MAKNIETHGDVLRLARKVLEDKSWLLVELLRHNNAGDNPKETREELASVDDAIRILDEELIPEEERYEAENELLCARKCETCGTGINEGYIYQDGCFCTLTCAGVAEDEWNKFDFENGDNYWTEWEIEEGEPVYTRGGRELEGAEV